MRLVITPIAVATLAFAAPAYAAPHVVGGEPGSIPALVEVTFDTSSGSWLCSGTVVSPNVVLTAAHCADGILNSYVVWTEHTASSTAGVAVSAIVTAPGYDAIPDYLNDAALLVLSSPTSAAPIALATTEPAGGTPAAIYGWGDTTATGGSGLASTTGSTVVEDDASCAAYWGNWWAPSDMCALDPDGVVAMGAGDSGGPLVVDGVEVGINDRYASPSAPSIFTRVDQLDGWIQAEIAANVAPKVIAPTRIERDTKTTHHKIIKGHRRHAKRHRARKGHGIARGAR